MASKKHSCIYSITHIESGKQYVGSTVSFRHRKSGHKCDLRNNRHHSLLLQRSWNKYGEDAFEFKILEHVPVDKLEERELYWLQYLKPVFNYSLTVNQHCRGRKNGPPSEETKAKIRAKITGFKHTEETKRKISEAGRGRKLNISNELREDFRERGRRVGKLACSDTVRKKIGDLWRGTKQSEETKKKRSESLKGKPWSETRKEAEKTRKMNKNKGGSWSEARWEAHYKNKELKNKP